MVSLGGGGTRTLVSRRVTGVFQWFLELIKIIARKKKGSSGQKILSEIWCIRSVWSRWA